MGEHQVAIVPFGWQMFVVHHRQYIFDETPQDSLPWHWHSVTTALPMSQTSLLACLPQASLTI
eukprot:6871648-Prorocentrum_lima.AAC.1